MITKSRVRTQYEFRRTLDEAETALLSEAISWRSGSCVIRGDSGHATGVITHPDDLHEFRRRLRERGTRIGVKVTGEPMAVDQAAQRKIAK